MQSCVKALISCLRSTGITYVARLEYVYLGNFVYVLRQRRFWDLSWIYLVELEMQKWGCQVEEI
jgi:hypothetical protein